MLANTGHKVTIFTPSKKANDYIDSSLKNLNVVNLYSLPAFVYPNERMVIPFGKAFKLLKQMEPDIIHAHTPFGAGWLAVRGAKALNVPLVGTHHTFFDHYLKYIKIDFNWMRNFSWKYTIGYYNKCDLIISPTNSLANVLKSASLKKRVAVIPNFIDTNLFRPISTEQTKIEIKKMLGIPGDSIAYMGRLGYEKSIDKVVKAFAIMKKDIPDLKLMLIGDGPTKKELQKLAEELGILKDVIFTGFLYDQDLVEALWANDVFITASKSENMPLPLLEAMATGLPVVSVREKGIAEIVKENENGFFAKTDDVEDIAKKVLEILNDKATLKKFRNASRKLALDYSPDKVIKSLENTYIELININKRKIK